MALIRLYMTTSLDGYVTGPRDRVDDLMGIGGSTGRNDPPGPSGQVLGEVMIVAASGAEASSASAQLPASTVSSGGSSTAATAATGAATAKAPADGTPHGARKGHRGPRQQLPATTAQDPTRSRRLARTHDHGDTPMKARDLLNAATILIGIVATTALVAALVALLTTTPACN